MNRILVTAAVLLSSSSLLLVDATIKGGAILLVAACAALALRRDSAATRHLVWLVAFVAILVVPVFSALLPQWRVLPEWAVISLEPTEQVSVEPEIASLPSPGDWDVSESSPAVDDSNVFRSVDATEPAFADAAPVIGTAVMAEAAHSIEAANIPPAPALEATEQKWNWAATMTVVWLSGLGVLVFRLLAARLVLWSSERRGTVISISGKTLATNTDNADESLIAVFAEALDELQIAQRVSLMLHPGRTIPSVWGLRKVRLLLPESARQWTSQQQRSVLLHELAHVKRKDTWTQLLAQVVCAIYWFNPLVWVAAWRLHVERERACDDLVLSSGVAASVYAEHLLNVATRLTSSPWTQACGLAMARRSSLEGRLLAVLSQKRNRRTVTNVIVAFSLLIGGAIAVPVAMLRAAAENAAVAESELSDEQDEERDTADADISPEPDLPAALIPLPKHPNSINLLRRWQALEGRDSPLKNSTVERMRHAVDSWIGQPPVKPDADKVLALRDWELYREEHPVAEVIAWLDRIAAINSQPIQFAINGEKHVSRALTTEELVALKFGPIAENGLRAAWGRSPAKDVYETGEVVSTTLVLQNTTEQPLEFQCPYDLSTIVQWEVTGDNGRKVKVDQTLRRGSVALVTFHVKPGQVAEILGYGGLTIGEVEPRPMRRLNARAGEQVTVRWRVRKPLKMTTGPVSFTVMASANTEEDEPETSGMNATRPKPITASKLPVGIENSMQWGQPVNGLRAALSRLPSFGQQLTGQALDFNLVLQNVSGAPVRLFGDKATPHSRRLSILKGGKTQLRLTSAESFHIDEVLQPGEVVAFAFVEMDGAKGKSLAEDLDLTFSGMMKVSEAPAGAWTGELQTPEVSGAALSNKQPAQQEDASADEPKPKVTAITGADNAQEGPLPKSKAGQALFKQWVANARLSGKIPGGQLQSLAKATSNFVGYNEEDKRTPQLAELLKRMDVTRDWTQAEAVELLDDVTDVYDSLPRWENDISRFSTTDVIRTGKPLPTDLKSAPWGEAHESGLQAAWLLDPVAKEHRLNTPLKSRILYHNNAAETIFFRVVSWNQSSSHQAHDAEGKKIETVSTSWTTIGQVQAVRLAPGEFTEVIGAGIGIGANSDGETWRNTRVGTWIHADAGDHVTFTPDKVTISGSDGRQREVKDEVWWLTFITQRLRRDAPLPDDDNERKRILDRIARDLFGTPPTADEIKALLADKSPNAMTSLAKRLAERAGTQSVYGSLQSGPTSFRVLPVDPDAKQKPYLAVGPGRYTFDNGTTLVIVGRGGVMDAKLEFSGDDAPKPFPIQLTERGKWAIAWKPDMQVFWIAEKGVVRKVDISRPHQISELRIDGDLRIDVPNPTAAKFISDALRPTFAPIPPAPAAAAAPDELADNDIERKSATNEGTGDDDIPDEPAYEEHAADEPQASKEGPVRSANRSNHYTLSNSRRLTMCRPTNNQPWITIHWPESNALPKTMRRIEPKLKAENYRNWAAVWEADGDDIWFVDDECFARVNISNPAEVLVTRQKHQANAILEFNMPEIVRAEFARLGFPVGTYQSSLEVTDGQEMLTSVLTEAFKVNGTVTGASGQPMANVPIRLRTALSPSVDIATTKTDETGKYSISFRLDLRTIARYRGIIVQPVLGGFTERGYCASGMMEALLHPDEKPQHVAIRDYPPMWLTGVSMADKITGPITRFGDRDLILGRSTAADFVLLPASTIEGTLVDLDGTRLVGHSVSITAPDAEVPRGYGTIAYAVTDNEGEFMLKDVPANELLNFEATSAGKPGDRQNQESATQVFGNAAAHRVLIEADYGESRNFLKIKRLPAKAQS